MSFLLFLFATVVSFAADLPQVLAPQISGLDWRTGKNTSLSLKEPKATVFVFLSARCPCSEAHEVELKKLSQDFKEFSFVAVHSNWDESEEMVKKHFEGFPFPVIEDDGQKWATLFGALKTPHVFVVTPDLKTVYQGGVTDSREIANAKKFYLREVLQSMKQGKKLPYKETRTLGCAILRK